MATVIVITNQKGGVGKTTTASALCSALGMCDKKVLAIDLDPQGSLSFSFGASNEDGLTIYDVLNGSTNPSKAICHTSHFDIITSDILLSRAEVEFNGKNAEKLLKNAIRPLQRSYDYIVIDTPPALNILTINAYAVGNYLIIPMAADILSLLGLSQLKDTIDAVKSNYNPNLSVLGILLTKVYPRTKIAVEVRDMANKIAEQIGTKVFDTQIRSNVSIAEAPAHGISIFEYDSSANASLDYLRFIDEISDNINLKS